MANFTVTKSVDFKNIYLKSDDSDTNTDYPVLEIYLNSVLKYTLVVGGTATVGGVVYETTSGVDDLDYSSTTTTIGTEYVQIINKDVLGISTTLTPLEDSVWEFKFIGTSNIFIGTIVHDDIDCALSNKLSKACSTTSNCNKKDVIQLINDIRGILYGAEISAQKGEFSNAECGYKLAKTLIEGDCNCGCS